MKKEKTTPHQQGKKEYVSLNAEPEDFQLLKQLQTEGGYGSKREVFHVLCNKYRGLSDAEKEDCKYHFGEYCGETIGKVKKVTASYCYACQQTRKQHQKERELWQAEQETKRLNENFNYRQQQAFFKRCGVVSATARLNAINREWSVALECLDKKDAEIEELKKPIEPYLIEIANLKAELSKFAPLENDYAFLKEQFEKLKHDPVFEKNLWLNQEVRKANSEVERLKSDVTQKDALIKALTIQVNAK